MACVLFSLRATSCTVSQLVAWWTDRAHGPVSEDADSYQAAFPPCNDISIAHDGTVTISVDASPTALAAADDVVSYPPSAERVSNAEDVAMAAAQVNLTCNPCVFFAVVRQLLLQELQRWMEDVSERLQQVFFPAQF